MVLFQPCYTHNSYLPPDLYLNVITFKMYGNYFRCKGSLPLSQTAGPHFVTSLQHSFRYTAIPKNRTRPVGWFSSQVLTDRCAWVWVVGPRYERIFNLLEVYPEKSRNQSLSSGASGNDLSCFYSSWNAYYAYVLQQFLQNLNPAFCRTRPDAVVFSEDTRRVPV